MKVRISIILLLLLKLPGLIAQDLKQEILKDSLQQVTQVTGVESVKDSIGKSISSWVLTNYYSNISPVDIDTSLRHFQQINNIFNKLIFPAYLGNLGSPGMSISYFKRERSGFFFLNNFLPYLGMPADQVYINTKKPFSDFAYSTGGGRQNMEQKLRLIHSQNINPKFNAGFEINMVSSDGQYPYQKTRDLSFHFFSSYQARNYSVFGHVGMNRIDMNENGGIQKDTDLENNLPQDIPTRLGSNNSALTKLKNKNLFFSQHFIIGKYRSETGDDSLNIAVVGDSEDKHWAKLVHNFSLSNVSKNYSDLDPLSGYYRDVFIDSTTTADSAYFRTLTNTVVLNLQSNPDRKFHLGISAGIINEINRYGYDIIPVYTMVKNPVAVYDYPDFTVSFLLNDSIARRRKSENIVNTALIGRVHNDLGENMAWEANARLYFQGYKAGNLDLSGSLLKSFNVRKGKSEIKLYGAMRNERPAYWFNYFSSNNFIWDNDFNFENETKAGGAYTYPDRKLLLSVDMSVLSNKVFFDSLALPQQESSSFMVYSVFLKKGFTLWKFIFDNYINFQYSGNEYVLPLPAISFRNSSFIEHNFLFPWTNGQLLTQLGFDLYYHTEWYAPAYMPATGRFYAQDEKKTGNYPFIDVFLNFEVKRTRIFLKFEHVNSGLLGYDFFTSLHYPMNQKFFTAGFSWLFHD